MSQGKKTPHLSVTNPIAVFTTYLGRHPPKEWAHRMDPSATPHRHSVIATTDPPEINATKTSQITMRLCRAGQHNIQLLSPCPEAFHREMKKDSLHFKYLTVFLKRVKRSSSPWSFQSQQQCAVLVTKRKME